MQEYSDNAASLVVPGRAAKRLLVGGICMASIIAGVICIDVRGALRNGNHKLSLGHDLLPSYVAGTFVRQGRPRDMYDIDAVHRQEARIVRSADLLIEKQGGPWLNPPFFAWVFAPLSLLPYRVAAGVFVSANLLLLSASCWLLRRHLPVMGWRGTGTASHLHVDALLASHLPPAEHVHLALSAVTDGDFLDRRQVRSS